MKSMGDIMKAAQQMQARLSEAQAKVEAIEAEGQAGAGAVKVTMNGKGVLKRVAIERSVVDPEDIPLLEDLILAAVNDAKAKADQKSQDEMQKVTGGLGAALPPGFKLPF